MSINLKLARGAFLLILILTPLTVALAQTSSLENLRSQLGDVQKKEEELQARVKQLDEDLRPENIEKFFALNGSTRPEELREQRRRQLESEKARVESQLDQVAQSRTRLESAIARAEAAAYQQSALPSSYNSSAAAVSTSSKPTVKPKSQKRTRNKRRVRRRN
ncbi:MAG TPA: hypothetical protein VF791_08050 [Pyrinomonadaceae bacterium]